MLQWFTVISETFTNCLANKFDVVNMFKLLNGCL